MNPIVVQIANGNAFFIGIGMTVVAFALRIFFEKRFQVILFTALWLIGVSLVILSATPIPSWLYVFWFALCIASRVAFHRRSPLRRKILITAAFAIFSLVVCFIELPFHVAKDVPVLKGQTIYVIGDSISAGIGEKEKVWPAVLGDLSQLKVINLARPGATLETAMYQVDKVPSTNSLIIIEIGGNDLLGNTDSHTFYIQLDKLLGKLNGKGAQLVMFELPLLPFWNEFRVHQRFLAERYNVNLIPKNYLVRVFAKKGDTLDGLHLSQQGHDDLAKSINGLLKVGP